MSIRAKLLLILVLPVLIPLGISVHSSMSALRESLSAKEFGLWDLVRGDLEPTLIKRSADGIKRRSTLAVDKLEEAATRLDHALGALKCGDLGPACSESVDLLLVFYGGDLAGVRVGAAGSAPWVRTRDGAGEAEARAGEDAEATLERESSPVTLHPVNTRAGTMLVTTRPIGDGRRLTAWGSFARLRRDVEQSASGRIGRVGVVAPDGQLLEPLRFTLPSETVVDLDNSPALTEWIRSRAKGTLHVAGRRYVGKYVEVTGASLGTLAVSSLDDQILVKLVHSLRLQILLTLAAVFTTVVLMDGTLKRLRRLRDAADQIGRGHLDTDIQVKGRDEIGRLAERFRVMAAQLRDHIATLEHRVDERTRDLRLKAEELERANQDLVRLTKLKSDFLARMSHELRTPLNSIIGFSELLLAEGCGPINEEQKDGLERVMRNGKNLLQLINDILDISKIEADRLTLKYGPTQLHVVVDNAVSSMMLRASGKKIALTAAVDPGLPTLYTDEVRLLQIINNLLSNAVKFTKQGGVTLTARRADGAVVIAVQDTGIGIAPDDLPKLFAEFYQTDSGKSREFDGTGLGLAITRRLAEALGGGVTVASELGVGSTFTVRLPIVAPGAEREAAAAAATRAVEAEAARRPLNGQPTILVIDDDQATHVLMAENLKPLGARFLQATTGAAGLEMARAERPDLILLDVRLPDRQGWEVLHDLKANPVTADLPVIVVSVVDHQALGFSLGAADYIVKPVNWGHLYKVLGRLGIAPAGGDVLVVDDDPESVALLQRALESRGFEVRTAPDGKQGLSRAREQRPGLIVLDLMMPVMNGFDTLAHLRSDPETRDVPVVVLTAKDLTDDDRARLGGRVDALFQKHRIPLDQLGGEVRSLIWKGSQS
jgi:signal transduction histidine kinase/DNA-binding response OmpR family regulator